MYYYLVILALGFTPWSIFLLPTCMQNWRDRRRTRESAGPSRLAFLWIGADATPADHARAFLWGWIAIYLVAFTLAATKLPNYVLPIYPAVALLTADMLERWRRGDVTLPRWMFATGVACLALAGVGIIVGLLVVSGAVDVPQLRNRCIPGFRGWAVLGLVPLLGSGWCIYCLRREWRTSLIVSLSVGAVLVLVPLGSWGGEVLDACKAPRPLAAAIRDGMCERDVRIGAYGYFQPSLVFYCRRHVAPLDNDLAAQQFLQTPLQVFLVTPRPTWERLARQATGSCRVLGEHRDIYRGCDVVVVTNR